MNGAVRKVMSVRAGGVKGNSGGGGAEAESVRG